MVGCEQTQGLSQMVGLFRALDGFFRPIDFARNFERCFRMARY